MQGVGQQVRVEKKFVSIIQCKLFQGEEGNGLQSYIDGVQLLGGHF